jgi:hypothetical protein
LVGWLVLADGKFSSLYSYVGEDIHKDVIGDW